MSKYIVSGAMGGHTQDAAAPNRIEINDFVKIKDQFSLYIQALQHIYGQNQSDVDSFFSIGGIHGLPYQPWDGAGSHSANPPGPDAWQGYCIHGSVLFPTFHRPYVFLFEQALQAAAIKIAATYTVDKAMFQKAAMNLRQPYWDWARNSVPPPEVISLEQVSIIAANGQLIKVDNPLRRYTFHPIDPSFRKPWSGWETTLRHPQSGDPDAKDDVESLTSLLKRVQSSVRTNTYNLLTRVHTWPAFSNDTPGHAGGSPTNSLEGIHDHIHLDVGGFSKGPRGPFGHMSDLSVAAFDPIFFLHHCNVDRVLSLWAALNPDVWVTPGSAGEGSWTIRRDAHVDKNTSLEPFSKTQNACWDSSDVTTTSTAGYTYPEFNGLDMNNPGQVRSAIAQKVNQLYGGWMLSSTSALTAKAAAATTEAPLAAPHATANQIWDWTARIQVKKYAFGGSFAVLLFLGAVPDDPKEWLSSSNFVGAHKALVNSVPERCANCRATGDRLTEGFVHLDEGIIEHSGLGSLEPNVVEPYLKENLHWRIQKVNGEVVDLSGVPSLEVTVFATPMTLPPGADFPVPGESTHHHGITHGRVGGSRGA